MSTVAFNPDNPFPGLRAYTESEADRFFGRQQQIDELAVKLSRLQFIAVAGNSGCGKSSLVRAGLLRELNRRAADPDATAWRPVIMLPGDKPIANLSKELSAELDLRNSDEARIGLLYGQLRLGGLGLVEAVRQAKMAPRTRVLLVVDQFEELFRLKQADPDEASAFVKLLLNAALDAASPVSVIITLRSDWLGYCADFRGLPEAVNRGLYLVPKLTRDQRKEAIIGPVELRAQRISARLVQRILNDVSDDFDDLPVMQHALARTWNRWASVCQGSRPIDLEDYEAIGTSTKAISMHAEEAAAAPLQQPVVESVFRGLTERGPQGEAARRALAFDQLCEVVGADRSAVEQVVERFRRPDTAFLRPSADVPLASDSIVDISHESLIRLWPRLGQWVQDEADSVKTYLRLASDAELYAAGRGGLLWDPALQMTLDWRQRQVPNPAWAAQYHPGFAQAMRYLDDSEAARKERREEERRERLRRRRRYVILAAGLVVVTLTFAWLARQANLQRERAEIESKRASSGTLASQARANLDAKNMGRALLLSVAAWKMMQTQEAQDILLRTLQMAPSRILDGHNERVSGVAFSPDSTTLASASDDGEVRLWQVAGGTLRAKLSPTRPGKVSALAFSSDGSRLFLTGLDDNAGTVWNVAGGAQRGPGDRPTEPAAAVAMNADLGLVVTAAIDAPTLTVWDQTSGRRRSVLKIGHRNRITALAISPDGQWLAATDVSGGIELRGLVGDENAQRKSVRLEGHAKAVDAVAFSPDGGLLASTGVDGGVILWRVVDGRLLLLMKQPGFIDEKSMDRRPSMLAFSPDGRVLAWSGSNGTVVTWDLSDKMGRPDLGSRRQVVQAHQGFVERIAFSPDSKKLASAGQDGVVRLWDTAKVADPAQLTKLTEIGRPMKAHADWVSSIAFSPDGHWLASAGQDQAVLLWDVSGSRPWRGALKGPLESINSVVFSPDGRTIASGNDEGSITLWSATSDRPLTTLLGLIEPVESVAFSSDGRWLASASRDDTGTVLLWDIAARQRFSKPLKHKEVTAVAFRPTDGKLLASGGRDEKVILWDVSSGRPIGAPIAQGRGVWSVAFTPDGNTLAVAGKGTSVKLWDVSNPASVTLRRELSGGHKDDVTSLSFSRDGKTLATGSLDNTALLWDADSGTKRRLAPMGHDKGIWSVAISPDGKALATTSLDETARLWRVEDGSPLTEPLTGHKGRVWSASFSPDSKTLATASHDKTVMLWDADAASWESRACSIANRNLRQKDWPKTFVDVRGNEMLREQLEDVTLSHC